MRSIRIAVIGDYNPAYPSHPETNAAIEAAARRTLPVDYEWVPTAAIEAEGAGLLGRFDGYWMSPGSPYASLEGALAGIRYARESGKPFVGT